MIGVRAFHWVLALGIVVAVLRTAPAYAVSGPIYSLAIDPVTPTVLFAGGANGVFKSVDGGATWSATPILPNWTQSLAIDPVTPTTVYAGTDSGLFQSTDGGTTWSPVGPTNTPIYSLAIDPGLPTTVYAGTGGGVFKSTDSGANWYGVGPSNTPIYSVVIGRPIDDSLAPTTVYAASVEDAGFFFPVSVHKTTDGGLTWSLTGLSSELWQPYSLSLAIDPAIPTILYATYHGWGCNDDGCFTLGAISKTEDGGDTWGEIDRVIYGGSWVSPLPWPTALAIDPKTSTTLYASWRVLCDPNVQGGIPCQEQNWTNKSTDRGGNWFGISGFSAYTFAIDPQTNPQSDPLPPSIVYAGTDSGVLKSTDGGDTWTSDTTPPDTSITSVTDNNGAALPDQGFTPSTTVTVRFTGTDDRGVARFECQLNGADFSPCTSPQTYTGLANRQHTFDVRTIDTSNNPDPTPARYTWTVVDAPPDTTITSATGDGGGAVADQAITLSTSITLMFTGSDDRGVTRFECQLDGASFSPCTSPWTRGGLAVGRHTFEVRAIDTSNNVDPTPARRTWTVDAPPDTTVISAVDSRGKSIANGSITTSRTITLRFTGTDNGTVAGFECRLDAGYFTLCTSPLTYTTVSRGTHTFQVRVIDNNGFRDSTPAIFKWTRTNDN